MSDWTASLLRISRQRLGSTAIITASALGLWLGLGASSTEAAAQSCCTLRGNVDCDPDGNVDIADLTRLIDYMYITFDPLCCDSAANIDADAEANIDISDLTRLIDYLYITFDPIVPCGAGQTLTFAQRQVLFDALDSAYNSLDGKPADSVAIFLSAFLNSRPEIDSAGVTDSISVWAWFIDGWVLGIPNNRFPSGSANAVASQAQPVIDNDVPANFVLPQRRFPGIDDPTLRSHPQSVQSPTAFNYELPTSIQARVTSTLGTPFFTIGAPTIKSLIENHGYVTVPFSGSVASLFGVQDDGIFYMDAHGVTFPEAGTRHIAIWTATVRSPADDLAFKSLLDRKELILMWADDVNPTTGTVNNHVRYGYTGKFVAQYMYFVPNSFIFINACVSDSVPSLRNGFFTAGASVYCGWTKVVNDPGANRAAEFLFDRMLGANSSTLTPKENPPQRPFDVDPLWQDMKSRGYDTDPQAPNAKLRVERLQNHFGLLAPSIRYMAIVEHFDTLYITGMFGTDPGSSKRHVYVGGTDMLVYNWQPELITCFIPNTGVGSVGPVTVEVEGLTGPSSSTKRKSNVVNLTEWHGQFTYMKKDTGTLAGTIVIDAHLRADIHAFREAPHVAPHYYSVIFPAMDDSYGIATVSGSASYTDVSGEPPYSTTTWDWHGSHYLKGLWENDPTGFVMDAYVDGPLHRFRLHVLAAENRDLIETTTIDGGSSDGSISLQTVSELYDVFPPGYYNISMTNTWDIVGSQRTKKTCCSHNYDNTSYVPDLVHTFSWPTIPASWAPDTTAAQ